MQMMYETIYKALVEVGLEEAYSPQDYLNFFCLGNCEAIDGYDTTVPGNPTPANTPQISLPLKVINILAIIFSTTCSYTQDRPSSSV